ADVVRLAFAEDGSLWAAEATSALVVWERPATAGEGRRCEAHDGEIHVLLPLRSGVVSAGADGRVVLWRTDGARDELLAREGPWDGATLSPDGSVLYLCGLRSALAFAVDERRVRWEHDRESRMRGVATSARGDRVLLAG